MGIPGGGRSFITPRFQRHFNQIAINSFDGNTMFRIFNSIMDWQFNRFDFGKGIKHLANPIIESTMHIYQWSVVNLLPTPAKTHYTFNLRDFSRVIQGFVLSKPGNGLFCEADEFIRLWTHEVYRVFYDRLVADDDRRDLFGCLLSVIKEKFNRDPDSVFMDIASGLSDDNKKVVCDDDMRKLMFGDFLVPRNPSLESDYVEFASIKPVTDMCNFQINEYNQVRKSKLNLVLFRFAIEHICKICRILKLPGGHALLVGVGGSGRQSLSRLATFIMGFDIFEIQITKVYSKVEWREDLKKLLFAAGRDNLKTTFLFPDSQIKEESFIEDVANMLNSGEVPNIFAADERQNIIDKLSGEAIECGKSGDGSPAAIYNFFIDRVKKNLHIILCMSPIGDSFRARIRQYASIVNCCTIDWFQAWPDDALEAVAKPFLSDLEMDSDLKDSIVKLCQHFHQYSVQLSKTFLSKLGRNNYVTPTSYLELLYSVKTLLIQKKEEVTSIRRRYAGGLDKLHYAASQIANMQTDLTLLQPQLKKTTEETVQMLSRISVETVEVESTKLTVSADEAVASASAAKAQGMKEECEGDLAQAIPLLNAALAALDTLKKTDIDLVKSMKNPPVIIFIIQRTVSNLLWKQYV
jgi:dynein heavy chain